MTYVLILGSTGSIGRQALEVLPHIPGLQLAGLAAHANVDLVLEQAAQTGARVVCLQDAGAAAEARARAPQLEVLAGDAGVLELIGRAAREAATAGAELTVLNGIVGAAGLRATMATVEAGATLALANKESMVAGGPFVLEAARRSGSVILPVDSEHSAIFQCLAAAGPGSAASAGGPAGAAAAGAAPWVDEILLTGSGGPFRGRKSADLVDVTPEQALKHPNWSMGPKITIDSATLMNKGLEIIEAHYLFGVPYERIAVVREPAERGAQHGAFHRRSRAGAHRRPRHAHAHRLGARLPGAAGAADGPPARPVRDATQLRRARPRDVPLPRVGGGSGQEGGDRGVRGRGRHGRRSAGLGRQGGGLGRQGGRRAPRPLARCAPSPRRSC